MILITLELLRYWKSPNFKDLECNTLEINHFKDPGIVEILEITHFNNLGIVEILEITHSKEAIKQVNWTAIPEATQSNK